MTAQASGQPDGADFAPSDEEPKEEARCIHRRTLSYDRYLELGGEPVDPAPVGITSSATIGWFVCLDCSVLSNDQIERDLGRWPVSHATPIGAPIQTAMVVE